MQVRHFFLSFFTFLVFGFIFFAASKPSFAQLADTTPPVTTGILSGTQGEPNWFRSDVVASLSAVDNDGGVGVKETFYKKDGADAEPYVSAVSFSSEGFHSIEFYSVDNENNTEEVKILEFTIDKTPPEIEMAFNFDTLQDIEVVGVDGGDSEGNPVPLSKVKTKNKKYELIATDQAGNTTKVNVKVSDKKILEWLSIESISYNDGKLIKPPTNKFRVEHRVVKKVEGLELTQSTYQKNEIKLVLDYLPRSNTTKITTYEKGKQKKKEQINGFAFMKMYTEKGVVKFAVYFL